LPLLAAPQISVKVPSGNPPLKAASNVRQPVGRNAIGYSYGCPTGLLVATSRVSLGTSEELSGTFRLAEYKSLADTTGGKSFSEISAIRLFTCHSPNPVVTINTAGSVSNMSFVV